MRRRLRSLRDRPGIVGPLVMVLMIGLAGCAGTGLGQLAKPQPYTETGSDLNGTDLRNAHVTGLQEAGSFRATTTFDIQSDDHAAHVNRSAAVNLETNRSERTSQFDSGAVEGDGLVITSYTTVNTTYRRVVADVGNQKLTRYDAAQAPYPDGPLAVRPVNTTRAANAELIAAVVDDVNWTQRGVERYEGGWVTRYEASGPENVSGSNSALIDAGSDESTDRTTLPDTIDVDVTEANATLLVSPDGEVRRIYVHLVGTTAGDPVEMTLEATTDEIGATTVEESSWVEDARSRTYTTDQ